jgi:hypothetical protein
MSAALFAHECLRSVQSSKCRFKFDEVQVPAPALIVRIRRVVDRSLRIKDFPSLIQSLVESEDALETVGA